LPYFHLYSKFSNMPHATVSLTKDVNGDPIPANPVGNSIIRVRVWDKNYPHGYNLWDKILTHWLSRYGLGK
jgi:hypothetical protein